jgi:phospholipid/cholesterol/gamma-HCH transport system substrate-binding protein
MKKIFKKESIIGVCVLIALVVLFFGIEYLKGVSIFKPANYYYAVYTDVNGLTAASPVTINGLKVGQVDNVELMYDNPGHVLVSFSLDKKLQLPQGTKAVISASLLGTVSVKLEVEPNSKYYEPGDTIIGITEAGMLDAVSENIMPGVNDLFPKVDSLLTNANNLISHPALINSIEQLQGITGNLNAVTATLNRSVTKLPNVMTDINNITGSINKVANDLGVLSKSLANAPVDSVMDNINRMSADLAALSAKLNDSNSTLGMLLNDTGLYDNLYRLTSNLDSLFIDIKKNPKRYINIKLL